MAEIVGVCNQKGGVGKTTTAINLAASLAASERRVLLVDCDPQGNSSSGLGIKKEEVSGGSYELICGVQGVQVTKTSLPFLDIIPTNAHLVGAEIELVSIPERESSLKQGLSSFLERYDYIILDAPPSLGLLTINVLTAVSFLLVPVQCEYYAIEGLADLMRTVELVSETSNKDLAINGIVLTMFDNRNNLSKDVERELREHFGQTVFKTKIPRNVRLSEAPSFGKPIILHDIHSKGALSYLELTEEFIGRLEGVHNKKVDLDSLMASETNQEVAI